MHTVCCGLFCCGYSIVFVSFMWSIFINHIFWRCFTGTETVVRLLDCHSACEVTVKGMMINWKYFPRYWPFVRGIHQSPVNSPHKDHWRGALMFVLICAWINGWVNNGEAGDLTPSSSLWRHCDGNGEIDRYLTTTKRNIAQTVYIFLKIYSVTFL